MILFSLPGVCNGHNVSLKMSKGFLKRIVFNSLMKANHTVCLN